ncbi:hypothetical protein ACGFZC_34200 [[Kitasatospora] papulosa]
MNLLDHIRTLAAFLLHLTGGRPVRRGEPGVRITIAPLDHQVGKPWEHTYSVDLPAEFLPQLITAVHGPGWTLVPPPGTRTH